VEFAKNKIKIKYHLWSKVDKDIKTMLEIMLYCKGATPFIT
jgi:hypothetical protein